MCHGNAPKRTPLVSVDVAREAITRTDLRSVTVHHAHSPTECWLLAKMWRNAD
jgi:hypothetical protein